MILTTSLASSSTCFSYSYTLGKFLPLHTVQHITTYVTAAYVRAYLPFAPKCKRSKCPYRYRDSHNPCQKVSDMYVAKGEYLPTPHTLHYCLNAAMGSHHGTLTQCRGTAVLCCAAYMHLICHYQCGGEDWLGYAV